MYALPIPSIIFVAFLLFNKIGFITGSPNKPSPFPTYFAEITVKSIPSGTFPLVICTAIFLEELAKAIEE